MQSKALRKAVVIVGCAVILAPYVYPRLQKLYNMVFRNQYYLNTVALSKLGRAIDYKCA